MHLIYSSLILFLFLTGNLFAKSLTTEEENEFTRRLSLYGLLEEVGSKLSKKFKDYDNQIVSDFQYEIKTDYVIKVQSLLGKCDQENCIQERRSTYFGRPYLTLKTSDDTICLPYTDCEFYKCMEEKYQCDKHGIDYFTDFAYPACSNYKRNLAKKKFTQKGHDWIYSVMICLQKGLIDECEINNNCQQESAKKTCEYIKSSTLTFHPDCYLNSGVGVCHLSIKDKVNIWRTIARFLTNDELKQAVETIKGCIIGERIFTYESSF